MTKADDSAFPIHGYDLPGLTKREWFAGLAMQGIMANSEQWRYMGMKKLNFKVEVTRLSIEYADNLIAELGKETQPPGRDIAAESEMGRPFYPMREGPHSKPEGS